MTAPVKLNFKVYQGSTFEEVLRWESGTKVYKGITSITKAAPVVITAAAHGCPVGWRVKVTNAGGMKEINSTDTYLTVTAADTNTLTINSLNTLGYTDYTSGGVVEYNMPVSLSGVTARMQIREKATSTTTLDELTTENGKIIINDSLKTITILVSAAATAAYTFTNAVYSMELINGTTVTPFIYGTISLEKEITR